MYYAYAMKMLRHLVLIGALAVIPAAAHAEQINSFHSDIKVSKDNTVDITETITYDFGAASRHGIFRKLPQTYVDSHDNVFKIPPTLMGITQDSVPARYTSESSPNGVSWKIGDASTTVTGSHQYVIHYQLHPVIMQGDSGDVFNLNITGNEWDVPITQASALMSFEGNPPLKTADCFTGSSGSTSRGGCSIAAAGLDPQSKLGPDTMLPPLNLNISELGVRQGATINVILPPGYVSNYLVSSGKASDMERKALLIRDAVLVLGFSIMVGVFGVFAGRAWRERRRKRNQTIVAQYEPPPGWTPAEIGLLQDNKGTIREITATLIDLAVRGFIRIEQTQKSGLLQKAKYRIVQLKDFGTAAAFEQELLNAVFSKETNVLQALGQALFKSGDSEVPLASGTRAINMDEIDTNNMNLTVTKIQSDISDTLTERAMYARSENEHGMLNKIFNTGRLTDAGAAEWAYIKGFELYLKVVEKDRLNFTDAPAKTPEHFSKLLPYAIALGVEKDWAKQFEGIDLATTSNWYYSPYGAWTALALADDLTGGFNDAVTSNFAPQSSASSMSGGSSGGGAGGGGGGSW